MTDIWLTKSTQGFDPARVCSNKVGIDAALLDFTKGNFYAAALAVYYASIRGSQHRGDIGFEVPSIQLEWIERAEAFFPGLPFGVHRYVLRFVFRTHKDPNVRWLTFGRDRFGMVRLRLPSSFRAKMSVLKT